MYIAKNDLRIWALYDHLVNRIEFLSESYTEVNRIYHLWKAKGQIRDLEVLRFDLCDLYKDK